MFLCFYMNFGSSYYFLEIFKWLNGNPNLETDLWVIGPKVAMGRLANRAAWLAGTSAWPSGAWADFSPTLRPRVTRISWLVWPWRQARQPTRCCRRWGVALRPPNRGGGQAGPVLGSLGLGRSPSEARDGGHPCRQGGSSVGLLRWTGRIKLWWMESG
jgi:hypothetical protein